MVEAGRRARSQPAPPHIVRDALADPRPWLVLLDDEQFPHPVVAEESVVHWPSLWPKRPDARIRFDLSPDGQGTLLRWTLLVDDPLPDPSLLGHLRKRLNELINADLRHTFGQ